MSLSANELERLCYITGDAGMSNYYATQDELERMEDSYEDALHKAHDESYEQGREAGIAETIGKDMDDMLHALRDEVTRLKGRVNAGVESLQAVYDWLRSDGCKTIKSRKLFETKVRARLLASPRE